MGSKFLCLINPSSRKKMYIFICIDYIKKWVEAKKKYFSTKNVVVFFYEDIFSSFCVPREIVTKHVAKFTSNHVQKPME